MKMVMKKRSHKQDINRLRRRHRRKKYTITYHGKMMYICIKQTLKQHLRLIIIDKFPIIHRG